MRIQVTGDEAYKKHRDKGLKPKVVVNSSS